MTILTFLFNLLLFLVLCLGVLFALGLLWGRIYRLEDSPEQVHYFQAADGWTLSISRRTPEKPVKGREPVILCHGLACNRFNFDFNRTMSMARYLAGEGLDCWVLELRGFGRSARRRLFSANRFKISFDDLVRLDLPAAVDHVSKVTGAKKVHWVGHSMGGMVAYGAFPSEGGKKVKSLCTIASPGQFGLQPEITILTKARPLLRNIRYIPVRFFAWAVIPFVGRATMNFARATFNESNMEPLVVRRILANVTSPISSTLAGQFLYWIEQRSELIGLDGHNYSRGMEDLSMPMMFIAGNVDHLASPAAVRHAYDRVGGQDKHFRLFGTDQGDSIDYGHGDLILGKAAPYEVFPFVRDWLLKQSSK
ncbi:MAG: alpha/beta fold hydrolase [Candidatus Alcyoniella australis]|nr:alpha/beta fold hydrolase [Candidatus Alcyoniella australis]